MPVDLTPYLEPSACSMLVFGCQEHVIGASSQMPGLATAVRGGDVVIARDPLEFGEEVLRYGVRNRAQVSTSGELGALGSARVTV